MVDVFVAWPMPLIWLMAIGLCVARSTLGFRLLVGCCALLIVSAMPIVATTLAAPLSWATAGRDDQLAGRAAKAVLVPTAGSFRDASGRWWPEEGSIKRLAAGIALADKLGLPVIVAGGSPLAGQPPEANTVRNLLGAGETEIRVVGKGRNSWETAAALAVAEAAKLSPVILVTGHLHIARMRAVLRRHGIGVAASIAASRVGVPAVTSARSWWSTIVPSDDGLNGTSAALYEYVGIAWYIAKGRIRLRDL